VESQPDDAADFRATATAEGADAALGETRVSVPATFLGPGGDVDQVEYAEQLRELVALLAAATETRVLPT
jgi:hypothetical protein